MRAYNMSMLIIFINAGYAIVNQIGVFGNEIAERASIFTSMLWLTTPVFTIPGVNIEITGIIMIATTIAAGTIVVLNTNLINDRGLSMTIFAILYYGSIFVTGVVVFANYDFPGVELFYTIFFLACTLIFIISLLQMPTGGQKTHV